MARWPNLDKVLPPSLSARCHESAMVSLAYGRYGLHRCLAIAIGTGRFAVSRQAAVAFDVTP